MRVILLGVELINLSTANHLAEKGYEVTIIEARTEHEIKEKCLSVDIDDHVFINQMENKLKQLGVNFRYGCNARKFITEGKRVRGVSIRNECYESETLFAERFVAAFDYKTRFILSTLKIHSPSNFKMFTECEYKNPLIGQSHYNNLFLNVGQVIMGSTTIAQSAKTLAEAIHKPITLAAEKEFCEDTSSQFFSDLSKNMNQFFSSCFAVN
ncbi:MAG: NAD-binding protein [Pseudomonadota bacterium]